MYTPFVTTIARTCVVDGCEGAFLARGFCNKHYHWWRRTGSPIPPDPMERFWRKVNKTDTCWLWEAASDTKGYGVYYWHGRLWRAHRVAYVDAFGEHEPGLVLDHLCETRLCVRPDHLEPVTAEENFRRASKPNAWQQRMARTHCKHGHEFTPENTYRWRGGTTRACRECMKIRARHRKRAVG